MVWMMFAIGLCRFLTRIRFPSGRTDESKIIKYFASYCLPPLSGWPSFDSLYSRGFELRLPSTSSSLPLLPPALVASTGHHVSHLRPHNFLQENPRRCPPKTRCMHPTASSLTTHTLTLLFRAHLPPSLVPRFTYMCGKFFFVLYHAVSDPSRPGRPSSCRASDGYRHLHV